MDLIKRRLFWLSRAWPLWLLILVSTITFYFGDWSFPAGSNPFNKVAGAALQGLGAIFVLISIDGNLGLFRGHGVIGELRDYTRRYPRKNATSTLFGAATGKFNMSGGLASMRVWPADIDGRVTALAQLCKELERKISEQRLELLAHVDNVQVENRKAMNKQGLRVDDLAKKVEETAVGGIKLQVFGVGLAVIGSVLSVYS